MLIFHSLIPSRDSWLFPCRSDPNNSSLSRIFLSIRRQLSSFRVFQPSYPYLAPPAFFFISPSFQLLHFVPLGLLSKNSCAAEVTRSTSNPLEPRLEEELNRKNFIYGKIPLLFLGCGKLGFGVPHETRLVSSKYSMECRHWEQPRSDVLPGYFC